MFFNRCDGYHIKKKVACEDMGKCHGSYISDNSMYFNVIQLQYKNVLFVNSIRILKIKLILQKPVNFSNFYMLTCIARISYRGWVGTEGRSGGPPTHKKWLTVKKQFISIIQLFKYIRSLILYMH